MTKDHDDVFDAVLSGVASAKEGPKKTKGGGRFLKRGNAISDRVSGQQEEKLHLWVNPTQCRMWARHNRDYQLLNEENCRDLIDGIRSQGRQEFPAIVRRTGNEDVPFEVICGARRHYAISWLQRNNYPQFKYLIEVRDLNDEEAFRLADIENRDREDISDYERAVDYAEAIDHYYGGVQKTMAARLEVSQVWLSRYLDLAKLPSEIVDAYQSKSDIKELHSRSLKPLLKVPSQKKLILERARQLAADRVGGGVPKDGAKIFSELKTSAKSKARRKGSSKTYADGALTYHVSGKTHKLEFKSGLNRASIEGALKEFLEDSFPKEA